MKKNSTIFFAIAMAVSGAGAVLFFWPLSVLGIVFAGLFCNPIVAVALGILFDIAYGTPVGIFHFLYFPFTIGALLSIAARSAGRRFLLGKTPQERI